MKAMLLAAGRGKRMRQLTATTAKPLLQVDDKRLIEHLLFRLVAAGFTEIVINVCYCAEQIQQALGDGSRYGAIIRYSVETTALETGGGVLRALPLLGDQPFLLLSADIWTDYPLDKIKLPAASLLHMLLVDNPSYHLQGDFGINEGRASLLATPRYTYANIGIYHPQLFQNYDDGYLRLASVMQQAILAEQATAEHYSGVWFNVGTPAELATLKQHCQSLR